MRGPITAATLFPSVGEKHPVVVVVSPSLNADGRKAYSTRGQLFDDKADGRTVVKRSTTPFCDAARVLLAEGVRPEAKLVIRHAGSLADALRSTVGAAAGLTVADDTGDKPVFRTWKPYDAGSAVAVASPMRQNEWPATVAGTRRGSAAYPPIAAVPGRRGDGRVGP
jgi:hypothetical protein